MLYEVITCRIQRIRDPDRLGPLLQPATMMNSVYALHVIATDYTIELVVAAVFYEANSISIPVVPCKR